MFFFISQGFKSAVGVKKLADLASDRGFKVVYPEIVWDKSSHAGEYGLVLGEQAFCEYVAQEMEWVLHQNSVRYLTELSFAYLKRVVKVDTLKNIKEYDKTYQSGINYKKEIRPADDDMAFAAGIYNAYPTDISDDTMIVRSIVQNWEHKYLYLVVDGKVINGYKSQHFSLHNHIGYSSLTSDVRDREGKTSKDFLEDFLAVNKAAPGCVFEIGMIERSGWAIVDTYPVWNTQPSFFDTEQFFAALIASTKLCRAK